MRVGVLGGTGPAGRGLAARLASVGVDVVIGSRSAERAEEICASVRDKWPDRHLTLHAGVNADAASTDMVVVATPWDAAAATAAGLAKELAGRTVVCMANALVRLGDEFQPLMPARGSIAVAVAAAVPDARVAAAFHHLPARELADLNHDLDADLLICADDEGVSEEVAALARLVPGLRPLYAGSLALAAPVEAFTAVLLQLNSRYKTRAGIKITGIDTTG